MKQLRSANILGFCSACVASVAWATNAKERKKNDIEPKDDQTSCKRPQPGYSTRSQTPHVLLTHVAARIHSSVVLGNRPLVPSSAELYPAKQRNVPEQASIQFEYIAEDRQITI